MVNVFLVDDHSVFRAGVRAELGNAEGISIVGDAGTVAEATRGITETAPDGVLLEVHVTDGGGLAVVSTMADAEPGEERPTSRALCGADAADEVIGLLRAGARGCVTTDMGGVELADAIQRVYSGDAYFSPRLAGFVLDAFASGEPAPDPAGGPDSEPEPISDPVVDALTRRELEVLRLLARGYTYREIGQELFISIKTVETHASNILRKTQQSNRYQLTRWAADRDLD